MIGTEPGRPSGEPRPQSSQHDRPLAQLDGMALAVVEADRLDAIVACQCVSHANGRVLATGEQHEGG